MTFIVDGTNGLTFNNSTTQASAGVVLQVVNYYTTSSFTTTSSTYVNTGFGATITPKFSTSKILILARVPVSFPAATSNGGIGVALYRNATALYTPLAYEEYIVSSAAAPRWVTSINWLDSPATTSSTSYNLYVASYLGNGTANINETGPTSITLMEIAA
jgi:hypothetical protein